MTFAQAIGLDQAMAVRERWPTGQVQLELNGWTVVYPQFVDTNPSIITNVQFRRALFHAINREQLAEELMGGLVTKADNVFSPGTAEYEATQASSVPYEYDPRRASQMIETLGYTRGADTQFRDVGGQPLDLEVRAYLQREIAVKASLAVVDSWKAIGVGAESLVRPAQAASNRQEQATFPGFLVVRQGNGLSSAVRLHSREARLPATNYTGDNNGRYLNAEIDALIDRYQTTIRWTERMQIAGQIVRHMGDQLPLMPLFYDASPVLMANHVLIQDPHNAWNAHEWDVRSQGGRGQ
jgi:peptide/nickel transport system substrate-binding protein